MELRVLRYFLAVVREESITRAAQALHVTQPTLSRQIMELEEEVGAPLLIRGNRNQGVMLTEKGMLLRRRAEELIELADKTQMELSREDENLSGDIYIGGGETQGMRLIAKTAQRLHAEYPGIRYHLFSGNADDVKERLDKGLLDFGITIGSTNLGKYKTLRLPMVDTWGLVLQKSHPLAAQKSIRPADLRGIPLLISRQTPQDTPFGAWLGDTVTHLDVVMTYNLIYNATLMVEEGLGCALALDGLIDTANHGALCFRPLEPRLESNLDVSWKRMAVFNKAAQVFLDRLHALC